MQVITTRKNADFDALASLTAACKLFPQAKAVYPVSIQSKVAEFMALYKENLPDAAEKRVDLSQVTRLIVTAVKGRSEIELFAEQEVNLPEIFLYSHHKNAGSDMPSAQQVTAGTGATTTILAEKILEAGISITPFEATLFVLGIYTATGGLKSTSVTARDVAAVSRLWPFGVDMGKVQSFLPVFWNEILSLEAAKIMSSPAECVEEDTAVEEVHNLMMRLGYGGFPVTASGKLTGIITRSSLDRACRHGFGRSPVKEFCSRNTVTITPEDSVGEALQLMAEKNIGRLPVGEEGKVAGIVTRSDIIAALGRAGRKKESGGMPRGGEDLTPLLEARLPSRVQGRLYLIGQKADRENIKVHVAGGFVRDLLLGQPSGDLDIVVEPLAIPFAVRLRQYLGGRLVTHEEFGTATLFLLDGSRIDLVTARREFYSRPAALPEVETSSLKNDLYRRDFTINTMAFSLNAPHFGRLTDFFGGSNDLEQGIIRVLYNLSFVEDPLRVLRAVRFEQRFGFRMEETTLELFNNAIKTRVLEKVSKERLAEEFMLTFKEKKIAAVLTRYFQTGIAATLFPGIGGGEKVQRRLFNLQKTLQKFGIDKNILLPAVYLAALMRELPFHEVRHLCRRLRLSREIRKRILDVVLSAPELGAKLAVHEHLPSRLDSLLGGQPEEALLLLLAENDENIVRNVTRYREEIRNMKTHITGHDLLELGFTPGPAYKQVLAAVRAARLDGKVTSREEELTLAEKFLAGKEENNIASFDQSG